MASVIDGAVMQVGPAPPVAASERAFSRASLAVLGLALAMLLVATAQKAYRLTLPTDGWAPAIGPANLVFERNTLGLDSPLRPGDELLAVDGQDATDWERKARRGELQRPPTWEVGQTVPYTVLRDGQPLTLAVPIGAWSAAALAPDAASWFGTVVAPSLLLGAFVFARRPGHPAARLLFLAGVAAAVVGISHVGSPGGLETAFVSPAFFRLAYACSHLLPPTFFPAVLLAIVCTFPVPIPPLRRRPWLLPLVTVGVPLLIVLDELADSRLAPVLIPAWFLFTLITSVAVVVFNWRTVREPVARAQARWVGLGLAYAAADLVVTVLGFMGVLPPWADTWLPLPFISGDWFTSAMIAVAILRYRLFDIDLVINRTLVYAALTLLLIGAYVGIVTSLGRLIPAEAELVPALAAAGVVAVLFAPLRERLQRAVNRLLYGERDEPYAVLTRLGRRLEATLAADDILPTIAETVASALRLPYVAIELGQDATAVVAAEYRAPRPAGEMPTAAPAAPLTLPLVHQGERLGQLLLTPRAPGEALSPADRRLLADLAHQAGVAVQTVRLTHDLRRLSADLQGSREQLVTTREEERRRLRRDLHDGLGPALASLALKVDAARNLLPRAPERTATLLAEITEGLQGTIADIRRLVYELRPPALDQLGLVAALRQHLAGLDTDLCLTLDAPVALPSLPAAVEVAAYRVALEAVTNVVKHAGARSCQLRLAADASDLTLEIADDGHGLAPGRPAGVGLRSMQERVAELGGHWWIAPRPGGGTVVTATLPLRGRHAGGEQP